jgi:hypothetical protein
MQKAAIRSIAIFNNGTLFANVETGTHGLTQLPSGVPGTVLGKIRSFVANGTAERREGVWTWEWKNGFLGRTRYQP